MHYSASCSCHRCPLSHPQLTNQLRPFTERRPVSARLSFYPELTSQSGSAAFQLCVCVCVFVVPFLFVSELFMSPVLILDMRGLLSQHNKSQQCCKNFFFFNPNAPTEQCFYINRYENIGLNTFPCRCFCSTTFLLFSWLYRNPSCKIEAETFGLFLCKMKPFLYFSKMWEGALK